jgi:hypothetical protein
MDLSPSQQQVCVPQFGHPSFLSYQPNLASHRPTFPFAVCHWGLVISSMRSLVPSRVLSQLQLTISRIFIRRAHPRNISLICILF